MKRILASLLIVSSAAGFARAESSHCAAMPGKAQIMFSDRRACDDKVWEYLAKLLAGDRSSSVGVWNYKLGDEQRALLDQADRALRGLPPRPSTRVFVTDAKTACSGLADYKPSEKIRFYADACDKRVWDAVVQLKMVVKAPGATAEEWDWDRKEAKEQRAILENAADKFVSAERVAMVEEKSKAQSVRAEAKIRSSENTEMFNGTSSGADAPK